MLVMAALLAASAVAAPAGFVRAPKLEPAASSVAGKPVRVWCATSTGRWQDASRAHGGLSDAAGYVESIGARDAYLSPQTCGLLHAYLNKRNVDEYDYAYRLLVLAHEAEHLRGISDESEADCSALRAMPTMIRRFFKPRVGFMVHDLMAYAWDLHDRRPPAYTRLC